MVKKYDPEYEAFSFIFFFMFVCHRSSDLFNDQKWTFSCEAVNPWFTLSLYLGWELCG